MINLFNYQQICVDFIKKNNDINKKNILFTNNNNYMNNIKKVEVHDKIYDPLSS